MCFRLEMEISRFKEFPNGNLGTRSVGNFGTSSRYGNLSSNNLEENLSSPNILVTKFPFSNAIAHEISISHSKISEYVI